MPLNWQIRSFLVPTILMLVAGHHLYQNRVQGRSAWGAGGGFGMFSTVDYHGSRYFRCYLTTDHGTFPAELRGEFADQSLKARALPNSRNLLELANQVMDAPWTLSLDVVSTESLSLEQPATPTPVAIRRQDSISSPLAVKGVQLEMWTIELDASGRQVRTWPGPKVELGTIDQPHRVATDGNVAAGDEPAGETDIVKPATLDVGGSS